MKYRVLVVDLNDKTLEENVVSAAGPVQALYNAYEENPDDLPVDDEEMDEFMQHHTPKLKLVEEGKWSMDLEDGLVFINHIDD